MKLNSLAFGIGLLLSASLVSAQVARTAPKRKLSSSTAGAVRRTKPKSARPTAFVYNGPGACQDENLETDDEEIKDAITDCSASAAMVARQAGYKVRFVGPQDLTEESTTEQVNALFEKGRVWIQPGGISNEAFDSMSLALRRGLKRFVRSGGGYVGFCAGGFMATDLIGGTGQEGLGIIAGSTYPYHKGLSLEPVKWFETTRQIYFEGGPYFYGFESKTGEKAADQSLEKSDERFALRSAPVEVTATYETGAAAAIRSKFGKGRVWVTGLHPEAPLRWTTEEQMEDPDGIEQNLAAAMVKWSASSAPVKMLPPKKRESSADEN